MKHIIVGTMPRVGSVWLFRAISALAEHVGVPHVSINFVGGRTKCVGKNPALQIMKSHDPRRYVLGRDTVITSVRHILHALASLQILHTNRGHDGFVMTPDVVDTHINQCHKWAQRAKLTMRFEEMMPNSELVKAMVGNEGVIEGIDVASLRQAIGRSRTEVLRLGPGDVQDFDRHLVPVLGTSG